MNQKVTSNTFEVGDKIHFFNMRQTNALVVKAYELDGKIVADVPNILLQTAMPIQVYRYVYDEHSAQTIEKDTFNVEQRPQPYDYFYCETELYELRKEVDKAVLDATTAVGQLQTGLDNANEALELATKAEETSSKNEASRVSAEEERVSAESARKRNESSRIAVEARRNADESNRVKNENERIKAEEDRATSEEERKTSEDERVKSENIRITAEEERVKNETSRESAETTRVENETVRVNAEKDRVAKETARQTAETKRVENEAKRVAAETSRDEAEQERIANEELRKANFESSQNNIGNAVKGYASGEVVRVDDVSPIVHTVKAKVSSKNLISNDFYDLEKWTEHGNSLQYTFPLDIGKGTYTLSGVCDDVVNKYFYIQKSNDNFANIITTYIITPSQNQMPYTFEADDNYKYSLFWYGNSFEDLQNIMLEKGDTATEYEPYIDPTTVTVTEETTGATYTPLADGTIEISSVSPTMTLTTDTAGVNIDLEYNQDTNKAMQNVKDDVKTLDNTVAKILENGGGDGGSVDLSNYYTKTEVDEKIGDIETALTDIDTMLDTMLGGGA